MFAALEAHVKVQEEAHYALSASSKVFVDVAWRLYGAFPQRHPASMFPI